MKKKIIIMLSILCLASLVVAGVGISISKEILIDDVYKNKIETINEEPIQRNNITCDPLNGILDGSEICNQKMWKGNYKLGEVEVEATKCNEFETITNEYDKTTEICISYVALSDAVIKERISKAQQINLEYYAKVMIQREGNPEKKIIVDAGEITLTKIAIAIEK
jgi:hypothetical protein